MLPRNEIYGSKWWKFDFHAHTPASKCYGRGLNQQFLQQRTPREWLLDFMKAGIDCVAITDHDTGEWIDKLQNEYARMQQESPSPDDFRPLYLFPGVEISGYGGVHILAIFDRAVTSRDIIHLTGIVGYSGIPGTCSDVTQKTLPQIIDAVTQKGGIVIPAHVDADRGLFNVQGGTTLKQVLNSPYIFAMEVKQKEFNPPASYQESKLHWISIVGSDAHHPTKSDNSDNETYPGARFTWVKMGEPSLEALRLAVLDGPLSILRYDEINIDFDPNRHAARIIETIEIRDAKFCGRGKPFVLHFNPWLNAIIGGRGTGKSTLVEFLRAIMRREHELNKTEKVKEFYHEFMKIPINRNDRGVLLTNTAASLILINENSRYQIHWDQTGTAPAIIEVLPDGSKRVSQGEVMRRFPVRIYSQKQIFEFAERPGALLMIMDEDPQIDRALWNDSMRELENRFLALRSQAREIQTKIGEEGVLNGELEDIQHKLAIFENSGHGEILKHYKLARRQKNAIEHFKASLDDIPRKLRELSPTLTPIELDESFFDINTENAKSLFDLVKSTNEKFEILNQKITTVTEEAEGIISEWQKNLILLSWYSVVIAAEREYEQLNSRLLQEGTDPDAYSTLVQRRQNVEQKLTAITLLRQQLDDINQRATQCLDSLSILRCELTQKRIDFLTTTLADNTMVQIKVVPYGTKEQAEDSFRDIIQKERPTFVSDILSENRQTGILAKLYATDPEANPSYTGAFEERLKQLKKNMQTNNLLDIQDQRFMRFITGLKPEVFDRLWIWFPEDSLEVNYSTSGNGRDFRSIHQGSPGQKTAAILTFLLAYGDEPIILDQPEDDLDNHLISDLVVRQVRENKRRRQIIVVTHNPNIVVNGDAELVIPMDFRNGQCQFAVDLENEIQPDGLQNRRIREEICRVMEGGKEAFEKRFHRITGGGRHV